MGLGPHKVAFLEACARNGVDFARTVTLGRQTVYPDGGFADDLFAALGAQVVDSIDVSAYEDATIVHDLNRPLPADVGTYSAVVDSGTSEHVFDIAAALRNAASLCALDGHVIFLAPTNGYMGHGFYQLSPDLLFRAFGKENVFEVRVALLSTRGRLWRLADPLEVGERVGCQTGPAEVFVVAQRVADVPFDIVHQADVGQAGVPTGAGRLARLPAPVRRLAAPFAVRVGDRRAQARTMTATTGPISDLRW